MGELPYKNFQWMEGLHPSSTTTHCTLYVCANNASQVAYRSPKRPPIGECHQRRAVPMQQGAGARQVEKSSAAVVVRAMTY
jgi:hypothetical protein